MTPKQLKAIRAKMGKTQAEAAAGIGVDARTWRRWELGERKIPTPVEHLVRMMLINAERADA